MIALYIILVIGSLIALILSLRVRIFVKLTDELEIREYVGPILLMKSPEDKIKVKPSDFTPKKHAKRLLKEQKQKEKEAEREKQSKNKKKTLSDAVKEVNASNSKDDEGKFNELLEMIKFIFKELPLFFPHVKTEIKMLKVRVSGSDAADCAKKYGAINAIASALIVLLENETQLQELKKNAVDIRADFIAESTDFMVEVSFKIGLFSILKVIFSNPEMGHYKIILK